MCGVGSSQVMIVQIVNIILQACITDQETPSSMDNRCKRLHSNVPSVQNSTVHLFDAATNYITTCYPAFDGTNENAKGKAKKSALIKFWHNIIRHVIIE